MGRKGSPPLASPAVTPRRATGNKIHGAGPTGTATPRSASAPVGCASAPEGCHDLVVMLDVHHADAGPLPSHGASAHGALAPGPSANASAQASPASDSLKELTLRLGAPGGRIGVGDGPALYTQVLKELLGDEMRQLLRWELRALLDDLRIIPERESDVVRAADETMEPDDKNSKRQTRPGHSEGSPGAQHSMFFDDSVAEALTESIQMDGRDLGLHYHKKTLLELVAAGTSGTTARCALAVDRCVQKLGTAEAPDQDPRLRAILESSTWHTLVSFVIVLNCAFMVASLDWQITHPSDNFSDFSEGMNVFMVFCESMFLAFYLVEFMMKVANHGKYYFFNSNWKLNILDFVLIWGNLWTILALLVSDVHRGYHNATWLKIFRLLRLLKVVRVLRVASSFQTLRAILRSLAMSLGQLFWCIVMLLIVLFMFALTFVSRLATLLQVQGDSMDPTLKDDMLAAFGSVGKAVVTLFMATTGGNDWSVYYHLWQVTGSMDQALFLFFIAFMQIALLNIILGVFVDSVIKNLRPDSGQMAADHAAEEAQIERDLRKLCAEADAENSGRMSLRKWRRLLSHGKLTTCLDVLGFRSQDLQDFFWSLSRRHPDGDVVIDEFVSGCMRLKGSASCFGVQSLLCEMKDMRDCLVKEHEDLRVLLAETRLSRRKAGQRWVDRVI